MRLTEGVSEVVKLLIELPGVEQLENNNTLHVFKILLPRFSRISEGPSVRGSLLLTMLST